MTREEELDKMSEADKQKDILKQIEEHGAIRITNKQAMGFWGAAIDALTDAGKVKHEMRDSCSQSTYLLVELKE